MRGFIVLADEPHIQSWQIQNQLQQMQKPNPQGFFSEHSVVYVDLVLIYLDMIWVVTRENITVIRTSNLKL